MNAGGQSSFELLFIALIVLSGAFIITGHYFRSADSIVATSIARTELSKAFQEKDFFCSISKVNFDAETKTAHVYTAPGSADCTSAVNSVETDIKEKIANRTGIENPGDITINVN